MIRFLIQPTTALDYTLLRNQNLLGFPIDHMPAQIRVILAQFKTPLRIATALLGDIDVTALGAAHLYDNALSSLRHVISCFLLAPGLDYPLTLAFKIRASDEI